MFCSVSSSISYILDAVSLAGNCSSVSSYINMEDFMIIKSFDVSIRPPRAPNILEVFWKPPPNDWFKINCDGAATLSGPSGCGGIARNSDGAFLGAFASYLDGANSLTAELYGAILAIEFAFARNWNNIWLETDSTAVVKAFNSPHKVPWQVRNRWLNCINIVTHWNFLVSHIFREGNSCADALANHGLTLPDYTFFSSISSFLRADFVKNRLGMSFFRIGIPNNNVAESESYSIHHSIWQDFRFLVKAKHYSTALSLHRQLELKGVASDLVNLNILMNCFSQLGLNSFSFSVFANILKKGYHPNAITLATLIKGLCLKGHLHQALYFHDKVVVQGFHLNQVSYGTLINGLCKAGQTRAPLQLLKQVDGKLVQPDVVMYNTIIDSMCKDKLVYDAIDLYSEMLDKGISPDIFTYNALIYGFCIVGDLKDAIGLFNKMILKNINLDVYTFNILVDAFCKERKLQEAKNILAMMIKKVIKPDVVTCG
ncbi:pentatricopeptide repeat-containing protein At1g63070, mitochondrial-like [Vicia villosa]|uniref:pentatricopeptide repeat-containing protein At1g63070, mitochondrial-like n=1 Tax=Vicia villosa TaxID=3911 RepID=UPI00273B958A|nr:pentatricopeptide repeat-containing protein At1g63070, mitochondrial-like [Vicia villosa]